MEGITSTLTDVASQISQIDPALAEIENADASIKSELQATLESIKSSLTVEEASLVSYLGTLLRRAVNQISGRIISINYFRLGFNFQILNAPY